MRSLPFRNKTGKNTAVWQEILPDLDHDYPLHVAKAPFFITFDFKELTEGELVEITTDIRVAGGEWRRIERHEIKVKRMQREAAIFVDDSSMGQVNILTISAPSGPWNARVTFKLSRGMPRMIRYIVFR